MQQFNRLPDLKYVGHEKQKLTLHLFFQIMGKIRLGLVPRKNHWWYITLYVFEKGFTTGPISTDHGYASFSISLNILEHKLEVMHSNGGHRSFSVEKGLSVSQFYDRLISLLKGFNIEFKAKPKPFDLKIDAEFGDIMDIDQYDNEYATTYWHTFIWVDSVFKDFSGKFYGKTCPVHMYWHSMDLAVTRFSGKKAPEMDPNARLSDKDAYSHECISFGFWGGDENIQEPAFYSYTHPSPEGLENETIYPDTANWVMNNGTPMAILSLADLRRAENPKVDLLEFMETTYQAGARLSGWPVKEFEVPPLKDL